MLRKPQTYSCHHKPRTQATGSREDRLRKALLSSSGCEFRDFKPSLRTAGGPEERAAAGGRDHQLCGTGRSLTAPHTRPSPSALLPLTLNINKGLRGPHRAAAAAPALGGGCSPRLPSDPAVLGTACRANVPGLTPLHSKGAVPGTPPTVSLPHHIRGN